MIMGSFVVFLFWIIIFTIVFHQTIGHSWMQLNETCTIDSDILHCYTYIPNRLPVGISEVVLHSLRDGTVLAEPVFDGPVWNNITSLTIDNSISRHHLTIKENSFVNLVRLECLSLHILHTVFEYGAFNGLHNVTTLDMTNSTILNQNKMNDIILRPGTFPKLEKIVLIRIRFRLGMFLNETFWERIGARPVSYIDISYAQAYVLDIKALHKHCIRIRIFKARGLYIGQLKGRFELLTDSYFNIEVLVLSECYFPMNIPCLVDSVHDVLKATLSHWASNAASNVRELYVDNVCGLIGKASKHRYFKNVNNIQLSSSVPWNLKLLSLNGNSLTYFDVEFIVTYLTLETLLLAQNDMEICQIGRAHV